MRIKLTPYSYDKQSAIRKALISNNGESNSKYTFMYNLLKQVQNGELNFSDATRIIEDISPETNWSEKIVEV